MNTNRIYLISIFVSLIFSFLSCGKMDVEPQGGTVTEEQKQKIMESIPERLDAEIKGMYAILGATGKERHDDFGYPFVCLSNDCNGADMVNADAGYNWFSVAMTYEDRNYKYANPYMRWSLFYEQIKSCNDILKSVPADTKVKELLYKKGQALAVRAFDYLNLSYYYQFKKNKDGLSVPIVTHDMNLDLSNGNPRAKLSDVFALIKKDIDEAIELLDGFDRGDSKNLVDQQVAYGIRARFNLYTENWAEAASDAKKAMEGYEPYSKEDVSRPTLINASDPSWLWGIIITADNISAYPSWPAWYCSFSGDSYTAAVAMYAMVSSRLWELIPETDVRKGWWVDEDLETDHLDGLTWDGATGGGVDGIPGHVIPDVKMKFKPYTNVKFDQFGGFGNTVNAADWCIMRASEMKLIEAEAQGHLNEGKGATLLTDFVRTYRDPEYDVNAGGRSFFDEVWYQRRVELWGEGFAFSDILRLGKPVVRFSPSNKGNHPAAFRFNMAADDEYLLQRIPRKEMDSNPGIPKNNEGGTKPESGQNPNLTDGVTK